MDILALCEGEVKELLSDPMRCVLPDGKARGVGNSERLWSQLMQWRRFGISQLVTNGLFGVKKTGRDLSDGRPARLIMDFRARNAVMKAIAGEIATLGGASAFTNIVLEEGKIILGG